MKCIPLSVESMAYKEIDKFDARLTYQKNMYLILNLPCLLVNSLIHPNFDYVCSPSYHNYFENQKNKIQTSQTK